MGKRPSLSELQGRAEEIDLDLQGIADALYERGLPDADRICSDAQCAVNALVNLLAEASAVDQRDELPVDGGIHSALNIQEGGSDHG